MHNLHTFNRDRATKQNIQMIKERAGKEKNNMKTTEKSDIMKDYTRPRG